MSDDLYYCAACFALLIHCNSEELECRSCGKSIDNEKEYLTREQYLKAHRLSDRALHNWAEAIKEADRAGGTAP